MFGFRPGCLAMYLARIKGCESSSVLLSKSSHSVRHHTNARTTYISSRSITVTNKSNSLTYTVVSSLDCFSPLVVIIVVGFIDILMVSNSAELRSRLLTMCMLAPESITNFFSSIWIVGAVGIIHSLVGEYNVVLPFSLSLSIFLVRFHVLSRTHHSCLVVSLGDLFSYFTA